MSDPALALLRDLVAIDSVNPALAPGGAGEAAVGEHVATVLRRAGLDVDVVDAAPGRPNVVGVLEGRGPGRTLMLCGHLDTVGVEGMRDPFSPVVRDGRLYGRGAQDMKSGVAAMIDAAVRLAARGGLPAGRLVVAAVADEEHASLGADALVRDHAADGAVVTEPTDLRMATCHKGFEWVEVETRGRAAHGSRPADGRDAILRMGRVLHRLEASMPGSRRGRRTPCWDRGRSMPRPSPGAASSASIPTCAASRSNAGPLLGEPPDAGLAEARGILDALARDDAEFEGSARQIFTRAAHELPVDHPVCRTLSRVLDRRGEVPDPTGMSFWTDAAILTGAGTPAVLFGPRGAGLHSREEYVEIESVLTCRDVLIDLARDFC